MIGRRWALPLGWAALILALTSVPGTAVPEVDVASADKLVHLVLYGVLGAVALRSAWDAERPVRSILLVALGTSVFGAIDELHQAFIPGRSADVLDWVADSIGGMTGALLVAGVRQRREQAT